MKRFEKSYGDQRTYCASARALKVPKLKGQAGIMKAYELVGKTR
jgi:hypothetical protein